MPGIQERIQELHKRIDDYRDWNNAFNNYFLIRGMKMKRSFYILQKKKSMR